MGSLKLKFRIALTVAIVCLLLAAAVVSGATPAAPGPTFSQNDQSSHSGWSVIVYGDTRFTDPSNTVAVNPKVRRWLVQKIADENPDAILVSGDLPYTGSDANDYLVFREETKVWRDRHIHFYPALGNHELKGGEQAGLANWWNSFPELNGRRWYSVAYRNVYFICLDTDAPLTNGSEQRTWFDQQIAHLPPETQFVFVVQHHPPIADLPMDPGHTPQANEVEFAHHLEEQAASLPLRIIVVAGHIHNYERFSEHGVDYLISGGGGAKPHPVPRGPQDFYRDALFPNYHYVKFAFDGRMIAASMVRLANPEADKPQWETKDSFTVLARKAKTLSTQKNSVPAEPKISYATR